MVNLSILDFFHFLFFLVLHTNFNESIPEVYSKGGNARCRERISWLEDLLNHLDN